MSQTNFPNDPYSAAPDPSWPPANPPAGAPLQYSGPAVPGYYMPGAEQLGPSVLGLTSLIMSVVGGLIILGAVVAGNSDGHVHRRPRLASISRRRHGGQRPCDVRGRILVRGRADLGDRKPLSAPTKTIWHSGYLLQRPDYSDLRGDNGHRADRKEVTACLSDLSLIHISEPTRQAEISYAVFC